MPSNALMPVLLIGLPVLIMLGLLVFFVSRYRRCRSDQVLVIFGQVGVRRTAQILHGGGTIVWPLIQDSAYLSLEPRTIGVDLAKALSRDDLPPGATATFTVGISTRPDILQNAAERLLGLSSEDVKSTASELVVGALRHAMGGLTAEQIGRDRARLLAMLTKDLEATLATIGLEVIGVNFPIVTA